MELRNSKTKLFCKTSFKNGASKLYNEAFLRDFLQKWSFETQKWSFSARLPSKTELRSSKTKLFCETSFNNEASKLKNEAFLRDFLQKWSFETQKPSFSVRLPSKKILRARIGSQATTKGTHHTNFMWQAWDSKHTWSLVTLFFLVQNVETVNRVTSDQCTQKHGPNPVSSASITSDRTPKKHCLSG